MVVKKLTRQGLPVRLKDGSSRTASKDRFISGTHAGTSYSRRTGRSKRAIGYR